MKLRFSKRVLENYHHPTNGYFTDCFVYAVYDTTGVVGTFLLGETVGYIDSNECSLRIDIAHHVFKSDMYEIINRQNGIIAGEYRIPVLAGGIWGLGTMVLGDREYSCKKQKPDIRYSPYKKNTWGHYKVIVTNENEQVTYKLRIDVPLVDVPNTRQRPFDGEIEVKEATIKVVLCGLFLLEHVFEVKDNQML